MRNLHESAGTACSLDAGDHGRVECDAHRADTGYSNDRHGRQVGEYPEVDEKHNVEEEPCDDHRDCVGLGDTSNDDVADDGHHAVSEEEQGDDSFGETGNVREDRGEVGESREGGSDEG